jgi:LemA protein
MGLTITIAIIAIGCIAIIISYNSLIAVRNQIDNASSSIDVMLKKRHDLIPNLVETVKAYMNYEQGTLTKITELRSQAISGSLDTHERLEADEKASSLMSKVIFNAENYPILQADVNFIHLQESWTDAEENISAARRAYNSAVTDYNNAFESFPGTVFAGMLHFQHKKTFEAQPEDKESINAKELFNA